MMERDLETRASTPILVVGRNRSGTKWLSNILLNHPDIAGVQTEAHCGILETGLFGEIERVAGDLRSADSYMAFHLLWSETDFFRASGVDREFFLTRHPRPRDVYEAFRMLMDEVATRSGARFWLQKLAPSAGLTASGRYRDCRLVLIQRDLIGNLESSLELQRRREGPTSISKLTFGYALDAKIMSRMEREHGGFRVSYERLRHQPEAEVRRVCAELGLDYVPELLDVSFRPNTSFKQGARKRLTRLQVVQARLAHVLTRMLPSGFMTVLRRLAAPEPTMHRGLYGELRRRYGVE